VRVRGRIQAYDDVEERALSNERPMCVEDELGGELRWQLLHNAVVLRRLRRGERVLVVLGDGVAQVGLDALEAQVRGDAVELTLGILRSRWCAVGGEHMGGRADDENHARMGAASRCCDASRRIMKTKGMVPTRESV
jgi:hypothetical protein